MPVTLEDVGQQPGGKVLRDFLSAGHNDNGANLGGASGGLLPGGGDDSVALAAAAPDVQLGAGSFNASSGLTYSAKAALEGRGGATYDYPDASSVITEIVTPSATTDGVRFNGTPNRIEKLGIRNTAASPSAGAGLKVPTGGPGSGFRARDVSIKGFYNGVDIAGFHYVLDGLIVTDPVNYGIYVPTGLTSPDVGDGSIRDCTLWSGPTRSGAAGIHWEGGGGMRVFGLKTNGTAGKAWVNGIDIVPLGATGELLIEDSVIDQYTNKGVNIDCTTQGANGVGFDNVWVKGSSNPTYGYYVRGNGTLAHLLINGGTVNLGTNATSAFDIDNVSNCTITDVDIGRIPAASPIIKLGGGMNNLRIRLGNLSPPGVSNATTWPTGTYTLLSSGTGASAWAKGGGAVDLEFSWVYPTLNSKVTWADLWEFGLGTSNPVIVEFMMFVNTAPGITGYAAVAHVSRRLVTWNGTTITFTTVGTDTQNVTDLDVQYTNPGGSTCRIQGKLNSGTTATSFGGWSVFKIRAIPTSLKAFS